MQVLREGGAMSAAEVHAAMPDSDLATVYRNLKLFSESGIAKEILINKKESLYEIIEDDHQHAMCRDCGKLLHVDIDAKSLKSMIKINNFVIEDIELNIKGHCK